MFRINIYIYHLTQALLKMSDALVNEGKVSGSERFQSIVHCREFDQLPIS